MGSGAIISLAAIVTLVKVFRGSKSVFGIAIATSTLVVGLSYIINVLLNSFYTLVCEDQCRVNNASRYAILVSVCTQPSFIHYWLFALKYLVSGINSLVYLDKPFPRWLYLTCLLVVPAPFLLYIMYK
jgi:hypothetical protein